MKLDSNALSGSITVCLTLWAAVTTPHLSVTILSLITAITWLYMLTRRP